MRRDAVNAEQIYSWDDYMSWPEEERWELIRGEAFDMSPAPNFFHQALSVELSRQLANALKGKKCRVFTAPFDVKLSPEEEDAFPTVLQPDLIINCDPSKWAKTGMNGAPELVVEILSPSTALRDRKVKFELYASYGVKEYWIISAEEKTLEVYLSALIPDENASPGSVPSNAGFIRKGVWGPDDPFAVHILPEIKLDLKDIFDTDIPEQD